MTVRQSSQLLRKQACPQCLAEGGDHDKDNQGVFSDGHLFCFAGHGFMGWENDPKEIDVDNTQFPKDYSTQYISYRGVSVDIMKFAGAKARVRSDGTPFALEYKYSNGRSKFRTLEKKGFFSEGTLEDPSKPLYLMDKFPAGSAKAITITEGEQDALSVLEINGKFPTVSVSSSSAAEKECGTAYDYLNSFDRIYLSFDNDQPGQDAASAVARLFDFNKVYLVKTDLKDASDYLQANRAKDYARLWWNAKRFIPEGIISSYSEIDDIIDNDNNKEAVPYPFERLQEMTYGIRTGEFVLLKALEGIGKTEIFRAFEYHLLKTTDANIGIIHLEEGKSRMIKGLVGYEMKQPIHLPDQQVPKEEIKANYRKLVGRDDRVHYYTHFGSSDPADILNAVRFLAGACKCKYIFLDHITMVVTGLAGDDERRSLDYISTQLAMMCESLDFALFCISHVNDEGQTRGSRNISKVADLVIHLHRDKTATDPEERNTTHLVVEKNRFVGRTGPCANLVFDPSTFTINEALVLPG